MTISFAHLGKRITWGIIALGLLIRLPLLAVPLSYSSDYWRQTDTAAIARHFWQNGFNILYPQIYWGGSGPGYVETEFQLYTFITALLYAVFGEHVWLGRFVSLLFSVLTLIVFNQLAKWVLTERQSLFALGFFALSPLYLRYSMAFMPEATVVFFYVLALYLFVRWLEDAQPAWLLWAAASTALAILVKPTAIHIGLVFFVLALHRFGWAVIKNKTAWLAVVIAIAPAALYFWHARNLYLAYGNTFGLLSGGDSKFDLRKLISLYFYGELFKIESQQVFGGLPGLAFLWGLVIAWVRRNFVLLFAGTATTVLYYMIVARYSVYALNYHVYAVPFAALGVGLGADWLMQRLHRIRPYLATALVVVCVLSLVLFSSDIYQGLLPAGEVDRLQACGALVQQVVPKGALVSISSASGSVHVDGQPNNFQEPQVFFYADRHGWSLAADRHTPQSLEAQRQSGAAYFVIYEDGLLQANPGLSQYLQSAATPVAPAATPTACKIFRLSTP